MEEKKIAEWTHIAKCPSPEDTNAHGMEHTYSLEIEGGTIYRHRIRWGNQISQGLVFVPSRSPNVSSGQSSKPGE